MTGRELANGVMSKIGTPYFYSAKMEVMTLAKMVQRSQQYPSMITQTYINKAIAKGMADKVCTDCSGLIGAFRKKQISSTALYETASEKLPISVNLPVGAVLWKKGHVGVYVGDGYCVEAKGIDYGTIKSKVSSTAWECGLLFSDLVYERGASMEIKGVDVSSYQGKVDWSKVKQAGIEFAILKIIRKDLAIDNQFESNWKGCKDAGVAVQGVYNYSYATTPDKATIDAKRVVEVLAGRKVMVWLDIEDKTLLNLGATLVSIIKNYQTVIEGAGLSFGVYTGLSFYNTNIKKYAGMLSCPFWIARYGKNDGKKIDSNKPAIPHTLKGWQYTSKGILDGVQGFVDLNVFYSGIESTETTPYPVLQKGSTGSYVTSWQNYLTIKGFPCGKADGIFGAKTFLAVLAYQKSRGLDATGVITEKEWRSVN